MNDHQMAAEVLQFAAHWHQRGAAMADIVDTLAAAAVSASVSHRGAPMTAAWLRGLADAVDAADQDSIKH